MEEEEIDSAHRTTLHKAVAEVMLVGQLVLLDKAVLDLTVTELAARTSPTTSTQTLRVSNTAKTTTINMDKVRHPSRTSLATEIVTTMTMEAAMVAKTPTILTIAVRVITDTIITDNPSQQTNNSQTMIHTGPSKTRISTTIHRWGEALIPASKT